MQRLSSYHLLCHCGAEWHSTKRRGVAPFLTVFLIICIFPNFTVHFRGIVFLRDGIPFQLSSLRDSREWSKVARNHFPPNADLFSVKKCRPYFLWLFRLSIPLCFSSVEESPSRAPSISGSFPPTRILGGRDGGPMTQSEYQTHHTRTYSETHTHTCTQNNKQHTQSTTQHNIYASAFGAASLPLLL